VWAAIAAVVLRFKLRGLHVRTRSVPFTFRNFLGMWTRSLGHAFLTLSALITIVYLSFSPAVVAEVERGFQDNMAFARQPSDHWLAVERAVQRVQSDQALIQQLRAEVKTDRIIESNLNLE
jgi:hypothetical protein